MMEDLVGNHLLTAQVQEYPARLHENLDLLRNRSMLVKRLEMFPVECVVRGYLAGSSWKDEQATSGHDENISFEVMEKMVGKDHAAKLPFTERWFEGRPGPARAMDERLRGPSPSCMSRAGR
ncbi:MAG: phosphoribosylaminoimidazolesuccinocarboxamide synthase [Acidobacteriota bacterium]